MIPRADERPNTIGLKYDGFYEEARAAAEGILPGYSIELLDTESDVPRRPPACQAHSTQGSNSQVLRIAIENRLGGKIDTLLGSGINTPYDEDDVVFYVVPKKGDVFQVRVAPQSTWTIGQLLCSAGDGTFEEVQGGDFAQVEVEENIDFADVEGDDEPLVRTRVI